VWQHYLAKQTLLLISVLYVYTSVATSWCRSEYLVWGRQGWSSSILERKLTAHYNSNIVIEKGLLPDVRAIWRHYRWTLQQDGASAHTARTAMDYLKKEHINFIEPHMWPPNSPDINPCYLGCSSATSTSLPPTTIQDGGITEASDSHWVAKTLTAFRW